jgi:hypothetical protein
VRIGEPHRREEGLPLLDALFHELNGLSHKDGARLARICVHPFHPAKDWVEVEHAKIRKPSLKAKRPGVVAVGGDHRRTLDVTEPMNAIQMPFSKVACGVACFSQRSGECLLL